MQEFKSSGNRAIEFLTSKSCRFAKSVGDCELGLLIEDVDLLGVECECHALTGTDLGIRLDTSGHRVAVNIKI